MGKGEDKAKVIDLSLYRLKKQIESGEVVLVDEDGVEWDVLLDYEDDSVFNEYIDVEVEDNEYQDE